MLNGLDAAEVERK